MTATNDPPDPTSNFRPFSEWTDDEIRDRTIESHEMPGLISIDLIRPIRRDGDDTAYVPAWIEVCSWDWSEASEAPDAPMKENRNDDN